MSTPPPSPNAPLRQRLVLVARSLRRRRTVEAGVSALGLLAASLMLLDAVDRYFPFREATAFLLAAVVFTAVLLRYGGQVLRLLFLAQTPDRLAVDIEHAHPELMDSYACAVELESCPDRSLRPLEQALHETVVAKTAQLDVFPILVPAGLQTKRLLAALVLFAALAALAWRSRFVQKAQWNLSDRLGGTHSGLVVGPGNAAVAMDNDVTVSVEVTRWENTADIVCIDADGRRRFRMTPPAPGTVPQSHVFTFYAIHAPVRYRVVTPSLASSWFQLTPYRPPEIRRSRIHITPPLYTGRKPRDIPELKDFQALVGSRVRFEVQVSPRATAELSWAEEHVPLEPVAGKSLAATCELRRSVVYAVVLRDTAGHSARSADFQVECIPDHPPAIDVLQPGRDIQALPDAVVNTMARAVDDLGIARVNLTFSISGRDRRTITPAVFREPPGDVADTGARRTVQFPFDLKALGAKEGDVLVYSFTAVDNRVPNPQTAHSEVYFIEVRPHITPRSGGGAGQKKKLDVGPLIAELKRLIRVTADALVQSGTQREERARALAGGLNDLHTAAVRKVQEIEALAGPGGGGKVASLLGEAITEIEQARQLAENKLLDESLSPQERALAHLISLENQLLKNAATGGKGGGKSSSGKPRKNGNKQRQRPSGTSRTEQLEAMRNAIRELRDLARRQDATNQAMDRPHSNPAEAGPKLAADQAAIRADTARVGKVLEGVPESGGSRQAVQSATAAMDAARNALGAGGFKRGARDGRRAHASLLAALRQAEDAFRRASANAIQQLSAATRELSEAERAAAHTSTDLGNQPSVKKSDAASALQSQEKLNDESRRLGRTILKIAGALDERFPRVGEAVGRAQQTFQDSGAPGRMTRAANAVRYRRFEKAAAYQTDGANGLLKLADDLHKASQMLPALSRDDIEAAAARMRQAAREAQSLSRGTTPAAAEGLSRLRQETGAELDRLAAGLHDRNLQHAADALALPFAGGNAQQNGMRLARVFTGAARILERRIMAMEIRQKTRLFRQAAAPPEKYRPLVEEYFKDLSESQ